MADQQRGETTDRPWKKIEAHLENKDVDALEITLDDLSAADTRPRNLSI